MPESYLAATERCASRGLKSGVVYDALHLVEAERADADVFDLQSERLRAARGRPQATDRRAPRSAIHSARAVSESAWRSRALPFRPSTNP